MDPIACLKQAIAAGKAGEWDTYADRMKDYNDWVHSGGVQAPIELVVEAVSQVFETF